MTPVRFAAVAVVAALAVATRGACSEESAQPEQPEATESEQQPSSQTQPMAGQGRMQQLRAGCPMVVEGTDVTTSDADDGVALEFTTDEGDVSDLRARVEHMARMYEMHRGARGRMMWGHMGGSGKGRGSGMGAGHMRGHGPMPGADATVSDIEGGARLELTPTDPSQLESLRDQARGHARRMQSGECWMWEQQGASEQAPE